ncbi:MAG: ABC transporter ATP-binding protein [Desulfobacterales bacterium]|nr:ABC transporter ATP-binding protein [Desulfobacterales bacterium]
MRSFSLVKPYFYRRRKLIIIGILCLMAVDVLQLFIPRVIKWAVDDLTALSIDYAGLAVYAGEIILIPVFMALLRFVWRRFLIGTSRVVEEGLRNRLFNHIQTLSADYFDRVKTGDLMAHATNDINNIRMAVGMGMVAFTDAVFLGLAAIGFMAYINVKLTLFALIPMPVIIFFTRKFGQKMHRRYTSVQQSFSELTEVARESFSGIRIVKAYNLEPPEYQRLAKSSRAYIRENLKLIRITGSFFPMMLLFTNISLTIVIFLGGRQTITGVITAGDFVAFINYLNLLTWPMMAMGWVTNLIQRGAASLDRINKILQTRPNITDEAGAMPIKALEGNIAFDRVSFAHSPAGPNVIDGLSFSVPSGRMLGIVGPQGSGKTTLLKLIPRIYDATGGRITIDGTDIRRLKLADLRRHIGFVSQEPFLFSGTIRENVGFGQTTDDDEIWRAVRAAALDETIAQFPNGLDTVVGEKGAILSGGQKQRIMLARALVHDTPILLMDDPIGQVDTETAARIIETLRLLSGRRTIIIVSHRIPAVQYADHVLVLDRGGIIESGTHETLIANGGYYARTHQLQSLEADA